MSLRFSHAGLAALLLLILSAPPSVCADSRNVVARIDRSSLDNILSQRDSRYAVVIMASWCAPCIDELPTLNKLYTRYRSQGMQVIGLSIDFAGPEAIQPVVDKLGVLFPVYWYGEKAVEDFELFAIPMLLLVKNGRIVEKLPGRRTEKFLDKKFRQFLE